MTRGQRTVLTVAAAVGGIALFAYALRQAGVGEIADGVRRVGWGLVPILALAGIRFLLRAQCWRLCTPPASQFSLPQAFAAFLAGDALGNVTPLGLAASEPAKVFLTRRRLATRESIASLALDNLVYAASVASVVAVGVMLVLVTVPLPFGWREGSVAALLGIAVVAVVTLRLLRGTWSEARGRRPAWRERLATLREAVLQFSTVHPGRLGIVFGLHMTFHALAVLEVFLTLRWLLGDDGVTLAQAIVFEALNRVITVAFKFVPFRVGVDEALSGGLATVLAVQPAAGVALAIVRKLRNLFWTGVGLLLIAVPVRESPARDRP
jgi:hypothetical protein